GFCCGRLSGLTVGTFILGQAVRAGATTVIVLIVEEGSLLWNAKSSASLLFDDSMVDGLVIRVLRKIHALQIPAIESYCIALNGIVDSACTKVRVIPRLRNGRCWWHQGDIGRLIVHVGL